MKNEETTVHIVYDLMERMKEEYPCVEAQKSVSDYCDDRPSQSQRAFGPSDLEFFDVISSAAEIQDDAI